VPILADSRNTCVATSESLSFGQISCKCLHCHCDVNGLWGLSVGGMAPVHTFLYRHIGVSFSFFFVTSFFLVSEYVFCVGHSVGKVQVFFLREKRRCVIYHYAWKQWFPKSAPRSPCFSRTPADTYSNAF